MALAENNSEHNNAKKNKRIYQTQGGSDVEDGEQLLMPLKIFIGPEYSLGFPFSFAR